MRVLVVGGCGFLGSNICARLLNKGHEVICLDNLSTGKKQNIMEFVYDPRFSFILHDITEPFTSAYVDAVVHCAVPNMKDPLHFLKTCSYGIFNVAGIARRNNARLIFASSSEWYDLSPESYDLTISEEYAGWYQNNNDRASGYQIAESILKNYTKLDIKILRLFDFYGPKMSEESFIGNLIKNILSNKQVILNESKDQVLRSCYIDDVVDAVICAVEIKDFIPTPMHINIGTSKEVTLKDLVFKISQFSDSKSEVFYGSDLNLKLCGNKPKIERAKMYLRWEDKIGYDLGIQKTIKFYKEGPSRS